MFYFTFTFWQLGLVEKNILTYDFDLIGSDPSDANTNSTTLLSDDTDDKSRKIANPEIGLSATHEDEVSITLSVEVLCSTCRNRS